MICAPQPCVDTLLSLPRMAHSKEEETDLATHQVERATRVDHSTKEDAAQVPLGRDLVIQNPSGSALL